MYLQNLYFYIFNHVTGWCPFNIPIHIPPALNETLENEEIYIVNNYIKYHDIYALKIY